MEAGLVLKQIKEGIYFWLRVARVVVVVEFFAIFAV